MDVTSLHVGRPATWRRVTVFPVWQPGVGDVACTLDPGALSVSELAGGPSVASLQVTNVGREPVLVLEGQLFEGGWQHRMALRTHLVMPAEIAAIDVACVEQGRWHGESTQRTAGRRATPYVRAAASVDDDTVQSRVWTRVESQLTRIGGVNASMSLVDGLDVVDELELLPEPPPTLLPGQSGVVVGVGGQPYLAEVFASAQALAQAYDALLASVVADAALVTSEPTPARRVQRFLRRAEQVDVTSHGPDGPTYEESGRAHDAEVRRTVWGDRTLHARLTNLRHPILLEA